MAYELRRVIFILRQDDGFKTVGNRNSIFGHVACQIDGVENTNGCVKFEQPHSFVTSKECWGKKERAYIPLG